MRPETKTIPAPAKCDNAFPPEVSSVIGQNDGLTIRGYLNTTMTPCH